MGSPAAVVVRPAVVEDLPALADVYLASRRAHLPGVPLVHSDEDVRGWVRGPLFGSGGLQAVLVGDGLVGLLATSDDGRSRWIEHLYLRPGSTGRGVGTAVLEHALGALDPPVRLWTFQVNAGARRFYERHGFAAIAFGDGSGNEEGCPDVLYERT